jgi:homoserine dehydrogenase
MSVDPFLHSGTSPGFARPAAIVATAPRSRVAILGCGVVGSAVAWRLATDPLPAVELSHVFDRRAGEKRAAFGDVASRGAGVVWTTRIDDILSSDADIVVEAVGGLEPAAEWIRRALDSGKSVVTANKQVVARHGPELQRLAWRQGRQLRFEASVGGGMPIVRAIGDGLAGDRITRIVAVLNGTSNAVLSQIETTGCTLGAALQLARASGWAEADPSADLDGTDAAAKLAILCALAFRLRIDPARIETRSIGRLGPSEFSQARCAGGVLRQIAWAELDMRSVTAWVAPALVPRSSIFAQMSGPQNAALITGEYSGDHAILGTGAGGDATSVAVIADLVAIARDRAAVAPPPALSTPAVLRGLERATRTVNLMERIDRRQPEPYRVRHPRPVSSARAVLAQTG